LAKWGREKSSDNSHRNRRLEAQKLTEVYTEKTQKKMAELLYADLTYKIRGAVFKVYKKLGALHKESVYFKALALEFSRLGLNFEQEVPLKVMYEGTRVGNYRADFLIEGKIVLEIKATKTLPRAYENQLLYYLTGTGYRLALLVNFGQPGRVYIKRWIIGRD